MDQVSALATIDAFLDMLPALREGKPFEPKHVAFVQSTGLELDRIFGMDSTVVKNFQAINYQSTGPYITYAQSFESEKARRAMVAYLAGLNLAEGILRSARNQLEKHGANHVLNESRIKVERAKVFISHGKETAALTKVERFVRALGLMPVIVVREPSEGLSVDDLVAKRLSECDCAIILATADDVVDAYRQPRPNVIHETGLAQERLSDRVIYLKEVGCEFPSNFRPKVWENFTQDNMEGAFEKIVKELRAFGTL